MGMAINTNVDALDALRNLSITSGKFSSSVQKLSSGLRINTAADDAAGNAISNKLAAQVTGLNQAQRNAQDGVSMVQTAAGALNEIQSMLQRVRELAVEAGNATVGSSDAASINTEVVALHDEINRLANATTFNGVALLNGQGGQTVSQTGGTAVVGLALTNTPATISAVTVAGTAAVGTYSLASGATGLTMSLGTLSQTINPTNIPASGTETFNFNNLGVSITVVGASGGTAANLEKDLDGKTVITTGAGGGGNATFQVGANAGETVGVTFADARTTALGIENAITTFTTAATGNAGANWAGSQAAAVQGLLNASDTSITALNTIASGLGAVQNRLSHTIAAVGVASENLNASESRIKDLDVASEMVNFTKTQILQQAGTAILAQANSAPQSILTLLR